MLNGDGLRTVLWVAGCNHKCKGCQNPITWDEKGVLPFDQEAEDELFEALRVPSISGITFSGGDPLFPNNRSEIFRLIKKIKSELPEKTEIGRASVGKECVRRCRSRWSPYH